MLDAVAFATGAALSAMLGLMQLRVDRAAGHASGYLLLWALGFVWTFGNFLRCALDLAGVGPQAMATRLAETFAWSCTLLGPIVIGRLVQGGLGAANRAARRFLALTVAISLLNLTLMVRANHRFEWRLEDSGYPTTSFYIALVVGALALGLYVWQRGRADAPVRKTTPAWFAPAAFVFAAIHTSAILVSMQFPNLPAGLLTTAELIGRHWTLPWSVLIAVSLAQAHYADVVLKRSLWLLGCAAIATAAVLAVITPVTGLRTLFAILAAAALLLLAPWLVRAIDAFVDRAILARPDYSVATKSLERAFRRCTQPQELIDAALDTVRSTLHAEARWDAVTRHLSVSVTHQARTLMQREADFAEAVGVELAHRLDAQQFETEQRALHLREERLRRLLTEAELKALRTQVDPHFLFNTLNTIADLIGTNPQQAERMTERLAECFRYALAKHSRDLSTLDEELDFARQYLEIEQVRFGERLQVELSRGDARGDEAVPSLLLQPLLENAIRHGLAPMREGGRVSVRAQRDGACLRLRVEDDGAGLRPDSKPGVGLGNVQQRLQTLYAQAAEFLIGARAGGRGTAVTIVIPLVAHGH